MKKFFLLGLFLCLATLGWSQKSTGQKNSPIGIWTNEEKEARFEIYQCGDRLCGKIIWLKEPNRDGKPKVDQFNPDPKLQKRPVMGLVFLKGFEYDEDGKWDDGTIYDPKSGKTYSSYMKILGKDKLEVKGYIGISLIGRSQTWTRVQ
ncbi:SIGNAL peptide protein [Rufibacter sp. DG15C]|jgi:uncharacterized protein (DUF2147 family)|uniref:DUF2147 domain-containing protein n=1 Tax=Rufibacter sp. DG15C TaxID=1379909 RepID=UPI00078EB659|nr:DUF2147 domain-containing protein [Rufibacter sp. DG15C]AMM52337.1 SIGNAL peptide protein [Rufibacter sp. DG15C]